MKRLFISPRWRHYRKRNTLPLHVESLEARELLCNTIGGRVYHDLNNNGRFDQGEAPLAGVTLELRNAQNAVVATAVTTADGFYQFERDRTIDTTPRTETHRASFPSTVTNWEMTRTVQKFNPALGALTAVEVINNGSITSHIRAESLDTAPRRITANVAGTLTVTGLDATRALLVVDGSGSKVFLGSSFGPQPLVIPPSHEATGNETFSTITHGASPGNDVLSGNFTVTATGLYTWTGGTQQGTNVNLAITQANGGRDFADGHPVKAAVGERLFSRVEDGIVGGRLEDGSGGHWPDRKQTNVCLSIDQAAWRSRREPVDGSSG